MQRYEHVILNEIQTSMQHILQHEIIHGMEIHGKLQHVHLWNVIQIIT